MHYNYVWHIKSIYPNKFQINTVKNIEVIWENVFSHARVMVIVVSNDLKPPSELLLTISRLFFFRESFLLFTFHVFIIVSCLFLVALLSPVGKGLTFWFSCVRCFLVFYHIPIWCLGCLNCFDSLSLLSSIRLFQ